VSQNRAGIPKGTSYGFNAVSRVVFAVKRRPWLLSNPFRLPMKKTPAAVSGPFIAARRPISRRHFLQGTGVALGLPFLDAMLPPFARAAQAESPWRRMPDRGG